jgi:DNA-binding winged helix-turn-helix (wHTH) protein
MAFGTRSPEILCFGTFEVDLRAGEMRKQGKRIRVQEQPFQVLAVLLQRPGEVVTREEVRNQIWPEDTFVDFDNSLNTAINKLREALGDSADNPRFIETLPRRGYRFLAPVSGNGRETRTRSTRKWKIGLLAVLVVVATAAAVGGWFWHRRETRVLTEKGRIVLGDFANFTGDSVFDGTLREGLSVQLTQSPFLSLVSDEGIHQTLRMMGQPLNARLTPEITREICQRTNSTIALDGSIALIGTRYSLILKALNCANGDLLSSTEMEANDKSLILDALGKSASEMRRKLGESLSTLQKYDTPLEQATTSSLEALQAYTLALRAAEGRDNAVALVSFERATQLDPNFAMAYLGIAASYQGLGETALMVENARKAFALRAGASQLEKLIIEE